MHGKINTNFDHFNTKINYTVFTITLYDRSNSNFFLCLVSYLPDNLYKCQDPLYVQIS